MSGFLWLAVIVVVLIIVFAVKAIKIVPHAHTMIVERLGKYNTTLNAGFRLIIPFFDKPREMDWKAMRKTFDGRKIVMNKKVVLIDMREGVHDFPRQNVITKDNVAVEVDAVVYYEVTDPVKNIYNVANFYVAATKLAQTNLRNLIGDLALDESLTSRELINTKLREILDDATDKWGTKVTRVELQKIEPPRDVTDAMHRQMKAERERRAIILESEGQKRSAILKP